MFPPPRAPFSLPGVRPHEEPGLWEHGVGEGGEGGDGEKAHAGWGPRAPPKLGAESCCFSHISCAGAEGRAEPAQGQAGFQLEMGPHMPRPWDRNDVPGRWGGAGQEGDTTVPRVLDSQAFSPPSY